MIIGLIKLLVDRRTFVATLPALALLLQSCNDKTAVTDAVQPGVSEEQLESVKDRLSKAESDLIKLRSDRTLAITPSEKGFAFVSTDAGVLSFTFKSIKPYADGSRVVLTVGNLLSADITKLDAHLQWGPVDQQGLLIYDPTPREMKYTFTQILKSGSWTDVTIDFAGVPPAKFGMLLGDKFSVASMTLNK